MKAITYQKYGSADVLQYTDVEKPIPGVNEVLIKVKATSLNSSDIEFLKGDPIYVRFWGIFKPRFKILGSDVAGIVESVGSGVKKIKPGDEVFADIFSHQLGGLAEYVCAPEKAIMFKPKGMTFEQVAALPQAGTVALQGLRDKGMIKSGEKVLINGAGGGAGSYAIQLAKHFGAEVTGVDNAEKQEMMKTIGADYVIDYAKDDFTLNNKKYDLILDFIVKRSLFDYKQSLATKGRYVVVGGDVRWLLQLLFVKFYIRRTSGKDMGMLMHHQNSKDLNTMIDLIEAGIIKPCIDKTFGLSDTAEAFHYFDQGHVKGKVVITI